MFEDFNISNEEKLLLDLCRPGFSNEQAEKIKFLVLSVKNWKYFADTANVNGVGALVCHNIAKLGLLQYLPDEVREFLKNVLILNLARNTHLMNEMKEVLHLLNGSGIRTVLLKGMALETTVYGNIGLRQMTDADILISKNECIRTQKLLTENEFISLPLKSSLHKPIMLYTGKHIPSLIKRGFSVDIHHNLFGRDKAGLTSMLYDSSYETNLNEERVYIPRSQLLFLYLVKHLNYHENNNESQIRLYADLVFLIETYKEEIINKNLIWLSHQAGIKKVVAEKLYLLKKYWKISLPDRINEFIEENTPSSAEPEKFIFFLRSPRGNPPVNKASQYRNTIAEIPGIHRKILFILGDIFPSTGFMKNRYKCRNTWKALLYYPHRLGKLLYLIK